MVLVMPGCGPNPAEIAKQKKADSLAIVHKQITEKELNGELIWTEDSQGYFFDIRDNKKYEVIKIGNQTWMAENLAYKPADGNYWFLNNDTINITKFGCLYDWETANKIAPKGWHLPTMVERDTLIEYLNRTYKNQSFDVIIKGGSSGFNVLFGGERSVGGFGMEGFVQTEGTFEENGFVQFWTSHKSIVFNDAYFALIFGLDNNKKEIITGNSFYKNGHYVRLIKDR